MGRIQRYLGCATVALAAFGSTGAAWADCALPNFGGTYQSYVTFYKSAPAPAGLGWASCKVTFNDAGTQTGTTTCATSLGVSATLSAAKLTLASGPNCTFSATFKITVAPAPATTYTASSITLSDDHLTAKGVGTFTQASSTQAFVADLVRIN